MGEFCMSRVVRMRTAAFALVAVMVVANGCQTAGYNARPSLPTDPEKRRIVVLRPDVELSLLHAGGAHEPNAEWTRLAPLHLTGPPAVPREVDQIHCRLPSDLQGILTKVG